MKVLKSRCEKVWLFDAKQDEDFLVAGFAGFAPGCDSEVSVEINGKERAMMVPVKAINSPLPLRMVNARLSLLQLDDNE